MLSSLWLRGVLEQEGLEEWRVYEAPGPCLARCQHSTREILVPRDGGPAVLLMEAAHALTRGHGHDAHWRTEVARLTNTHTVPVCRGALGMEG